MPVLGVNQNFAFPVAISLVSFFMGFTLLVLMKEAQALTDSYDGGVAGI